VHDPTWLGLGEVLVHDDDVRLVDRPCGEELDVSRQGPPCGLDGFDGNVADESATKKSAIFLSPWGSQAGSRGTWASSILPKAVKYGRLEEE